MSVRRVILGCLVASAVTLSGCGINPGTTSADGSGGDDKKEQPKVEKTQTPEDKKLEPALLTPTEVGVGFSVEEPDDEEANPKPDQTDNQRCTDILRAETQEKPSAELERLFTSTENGPRVVQNLAKFDTQDAASKAVQLFTPLLKECTRWTETTESFARTYTVVTPELASYADETATVGVSLAAHQYSMQVQFVMIRSGVHACMLVISAPSLDGLDVGDVAGKATAKLEKLDSTNQSATPTPTP